MFNDVKVLLRTLCVLGLCSGLPQSAKSEPAAPLKPISPKEFYQRAQSQLAKEVSATELRRWMDEKSVVLLDLRSPEAFAYGHLEGAVNLPATELTEQALQRLVPSMQSRIAVYCDDTLFPTRRVALTTLGYPTIQQLGYREVFLLEELWHAPECKASKEELDLSDPDGRQICGKLLPIVSAQSPEKDNIEPRK